MLKKKKVEHPSLIYVEDIITCEICITPLKEHTSLEDLKELQTKQLIKSRDVVNKHDVFLEKLLSVFFLLKVQIKLSLQ